MIRRSLAAAAAVALAALTVVPAGPASARAVPGPRSEEWWFPAWDIQNKVWPLTQGAGVTVALIDSGVNASLPGLSDVVMPGINIDDQKGDGRTDTDAEKGGGHGTAMAELVAGQGQDFGMVGVAPEAKILPIVAGRYEENVAPAIRYAADHGAKVINISEAFPDVPVQGHVCPFPVQAATAYAAQKDVVVVAGVGNEGSTTNRTMWPADCPGVLAVGAVNGKKIPWTDTERQSYVSVVAPGVQISSVWKGNAGWSDRRFAKGSGTSPAAALASGAIALIRAKNPNLSARQVVQRVINTAIDAGPSGHDVYTGSGVMIPFRSMTQDVPANAPNPPYAALDKYLASHKQPPLPTAQNGKPGAAEKSSNTGLVITIVIVAVLAVIVAVIVVVLLSRRRRGGARPVVHEQPFPGGPGQSPPGPRQFPPGPGPYGYPQGPAGRPVGRPQGPPPSFGPPDDRRDPQN